MVETININSIISDFGSASRAQSDEILKNHFQNILEFILLDLDGRVPLLNRLNDGVSRVGNHEIFPCTLKFAKENFHTFYGTNPGIIAVFIAALRDDDFLYEVIKQYDIVESNMISILYYTTNILKLMQAIESLPPTKIDKWFRIMTSLYQRQDYDFGESSNRDIIEYYVEKYKDNQRIIKYLWSKCNDGSFHLDWYTSNKLENYQKWIAISWIKDITQLGKLAMYEKTRLSYRGFALE